MKCCCSQKKVITSDKAPKAIGPYSMAVSTGCLVYTSGQLGLNPATGTLVEGGVQAQTRQALEHVKSVLEAAGTTLENVVKTTVFLLDMNDFAQMNAVYAEYFTSDQPARSAFQVAALPKGAAVEIEVVATVPCDCDEEGCCQ
jgi:2-iminobutanoate/2-iminopropanoate deaminase